MGFQKTIVIVGHGFIIVMAAALGCSSDVLQDTSVPDPFAFQNAGTGPCTDFVAHYNSLPCVNEPLSEESSCSSSVFQFCTGAAQYYECRIANTACEGGDLVSEIDECNDLLDC